MISSCNQVRSTGSFTLLLGADNNICSSILCLNSRSIGLALSASLLAVGAPLHAGPRARVCWNGTRTTNIRFSSVRVCFFVLSGVNSRIAPCTRARKKEDELDRGCSKCAADTQATFHIRANKRSITLFLPSTKTSTSDSVWVILSTFHPSSAKLRPPHPRHSHSQWVEQDSETPSIFSEATYRPSMAGRLHMLKQMHPLWPKRFQKARTPQACNQL